MRILAAAAAVLLVASIARAQHGAPAPAAGPAPALAGLGDLHHPVSTRNAEAQRFFDQGLRLSFAFNHDEAYRSFRRASELDPGLAMAWWGMALVLGPNINLPMDEARGREARERAQRARTLARTAPEHERAYIEALAARYSSDPRADRAALDLAYKEAMGRLAARYPDDLDAATLYAEAAMDLRPWQYWSADGTPAEGTEEIVNVLESVLRRDPGHIGANHLLIHAVEASPHPELALGAAERLSGAAPGAGHLLHMPSHIYARLGDHAASARINDHAAAVDREYIERHRVEGVYPLMYYNHNLHFAAYSHAAQGNFKEAIRSAQQVYAQAAPATKDMPMAELFTPTPLLVQVRFRRWDDVLRATEPPAHMPITRGIRRFARGMAHAAKRRVALAETERRALEETISALPQDAMVGLSPARSVLRVAAHLLDGRIAEARGHGAQAVERLRLALEAEEELPYDEPPDWYLHAGESLGGLLLRQRRAAQAEQAFRDELRRHPRNGRALFGLMEALKTQRKSYAEAAVRREFEAVWKQADSRLTVADL